MSQSNDDDPNNPMLDVAILDDDKNVDAERVEPICEKPKKTRASHKRSKVWDHYDSFIDENGVQKSSCRYCGKVYNSSTKRHGTSTLLCHMNSCVSNPQNKDSAQTHLMLQSDEKKVNLLAWKFDQQATRKALAHMVIVDELPFKLVEGKGFRHFLSVCQPLFQIPSRFTVARDIRSFYLEEMKKVRGLIKENVGRICLTTDTWTSLQKVNYMCVTAHFVHNDWNLQKRILSFKPISSHRGVEIGKCVEMCLIEWGIDNLFTVSVDNASANDTAMTYLKSQLVNYDKCILGGKWVHFRCVAHIMNLIVQDGLSNIGSSVECVRAAIKYIRQSPQRLKVFRQCGEYEKCGSSKNLVLDVPTRWNSTYLMLSTAEIYERAFKRYANEDSDFRDDLSKTGEPTDWANIRRLIGFLEHFYEVTLKVFMTKFVTSNSLLDNISCIVVLLRKCVNESDDVNIIQMAGLMRVKFDKYYGRIDKHNMLIFVASLLDPRNKYAYMELVLIELYGKVDGSSILSLIKEAVQEIYDDYVRIHSDVATSIIPSSSSMSSSQFGKRNSPADMEPSKVLKDKFRLELKRRKEESGLMASKSDLDKYLKEEVEEDSKKFSILDWWKVNSLRFPILSLMARDVLAIPVSTVASEYVFSTSGRVLDAFRSSLTPKLVQALICCQDWLRVNAPPIEVEEACEDLLPLEEDYEDGVRGNIS